MNTIGNLAVQLDAASNHILFHHNPEDTDGYITIARKNKAACKFEQYFYKPAELASHLTQLMGEDVFFSQNTFYRKARRIETIRQLRALYVDIDFYLFNYDPDWILGKLELEFYRQTIPEPNMIIFSGQGIVLIWSIEPVPYKALPLWQAIQNYLVEQLKPLGGDPKAADAARIFRIAGSVSSKNGREVKVQYRHDYKYTLRDIQHDYLPQLTPKREKAKPGRKPKIVQLFNIYSLHHARVKDIVKLIELRHGECDGQREVMLFLYRYWTCCFTQDPSEALQQTLEINRLFTHPLSEREATKATASAEKAWEAKSDKDADERAKAMGYPGAGYRISNAKLIDWLDITEDEQRHLKTIISTKEKNRRKRVKYHENPEPKRAKARARKRAQGAKPIEVHRQLQQHKVEDKLQTIRRVLSDTPTLSNRKLAKQLGVSEAYIRKLKTRL